MKHTLLTILILLQLIKLSFAQEVTTGFRRITFFNPLNPGSFSLQLGDIELSSHSVVTKVAFNKFYKPDSMFLPLNNVCSYLESDTIDLPEGKTLLSFEWKFKSLNIANVLRDDSTLKIEHQVYDIDMKKTISVPLIVRIADETPVYDSSAWRFRREFVKYGTRTFEINSSRERNIVLRTNIALAFCLT